MTHEPFTDIERRLQQALQQEASLAMTMTDTPRELRRWHENLKHRRTRFRLAAVAAAAAAVAGTVVGISLATGGSTPARPHSAQALTSLKQLSPAPAGLAVTTLRGPAEARAEGLGSLWAIGRPGHFYRLSAGGTRIEATFTVPRRYASPQDSGYYGYYTPQPVGSILLLAVHDASGPEGYAVLDPVGHVRHFLPARQAGQIAADATGAWVQVGPAAVRRVDSGGHYAGAAVPLAVAPNSAIVAMTAARDGGVWVVESGTTPLLLRLTPAGGTEATAGLSGQPVGMVATSTAVYVADDNYGLVRFDAATLRMTARAHNDVANASFFALAVAPDGSLWAQPVTGGVMELDPMTLAPIRSLRLNEPASAGDVWSLVVTDSRIIISEAGQHRIRSFARP
jgi:hypothetical protein